MTRIAYFVHGRGKGHAVRTKSVLGHLPTSLEVRLFCAGEAFDILGDHPSSEEVLTHAPGRGVARSFSLRLRADRRRLREWRPCVVVSDGDGPSVHAAWSLGIPVLAVGHGLVFGHAELGVRLPWRSVVRERINSASSSWPAARRVAVHFAPARAATAGTRVVRPDLRVPRELPRPREDFLLAYFRDGNGTDALERLAARGHRIVSFGRPRRVPRGVELAEPGVDAFAEALTRCRAVVGSAGNQLPAECAMLGIPMLALHRERDAEHEMNARLIESAGIGVAGCVEHVDAPLLRRFEAELDKDRTQLAARTQAMPPASKVIPQVIDELCKRRPFSLRPPIPSLGR